ncbi:PREDICTED: transport [Prunus dulcis]|uniref:PREDICTED: transport n=1 Tax=Prunus dulcis TaxID=3755 RepID=A0A5E4EFW5_PRUDU|nr:protein transport protein Sec24-like At4g32640 isoform X1 [Prunus dulcis]VVA14675.1 PREDICTED: transport [Prunus dulcis]
MAAPVPPGPPRPGDRPPPPNYNYNPSHSVLPPNSDSLSQNLQNLNLNRPPSMPTSAPRPSPPPKSAPSPSPLARPAQRRPLSGSPPVGPSSQPSFPPYVGPPRPSGPPATSPLGYRPPPPNNAFPPAPPPGILPRFPPPGSGPSTTMAAALAPPHPLAQPQPPQTMHSVLGSSVGRAPGPALQQPPPFSVASQGLQQPHPPQTWSMQPNQAPQTAPTSLQQQTMFGTPPSLPNQSMTSISHAVGQTGAPVAGPSKIDPNQIPRPIPNSSVIVHETRQCNQANPPPPTTSDYIVRDTGNCSPRNMRCTINQIPCTADLLATSGMQLALLLQPLALPQPSEEPIPVVDFGESGPLRCSRCKGYINPFMKFIDQGRQFVCNLCGFTDETPRDYHCNLGPDGRRRDSDDRPELCRGMVEFVASKEYMVRDPMLSMYFFLIDVSMNAMQTGATAAACSAIRQVISDLPEGPRTMVGIATFDTTIHFYNLKRSLQQPLMLIVPDVQDVYTPLQTDVIVQLSECRQHLDLLLESIPSLFQDNKTADSAFGAAVKAAFLAMKSNGGKLLVFQSVMPSIGTGALSAREAEGRTNTSAGEKEVHKLLQPAEKILKTMAVEVAEYQVCVDIFITTQTYIDIASMSVIPRITGGQVYYYYPFSAVADSAKIYNDLRWNVTRPQGFEAVMRVRCSQGLQVQEYHGNFCKRIPTDVDLPGIDCDKTIMVTIKHDDKLQDGSECAFQCALLYTTLYGQRRIRVTTLSLPCTSMLNNLFRTADLDTQFACILKQAAIEIPSCPLMQVRERLTDRCIRILCSYRKFCATVSSSGQLVLPETLKLLPLYILALTKSTGLRAAGKLDERSFWINYVSSVSTPLAIALVYPRMVAIHDLLSKTDESPFPPAIPLSSEHISDEGIYLLENGEDCLIYIGNSVDPDMLTKLFGISSVDEIPTQFVLQQHDNPFSKKLNDLINEIRRQRCSYLRLKLCKKGDPSGMLFFSYIVEDKSLNGLSYIEFLIHIHRQIQMKM